VRRQEHDQVVLLPIVFLLLNRLPITGMLDMNRHALVLADISWLASNFRRSPPCDDSE